jgi:glutaminyl-peptide cyclotransferase
MNIKSNFLRPGVLIIPIHLILIVLIVSCCTSNHTNSTKKNNKKPKENKFQLTALSEGKPVKIGSPFEISITSTKNLMPDSIIALCENQPVMLNKRNSIHYSCQTNVTKCGSHTISFNIKYSDSLTEYHNLNVLFLPTQAPKEYTFNVLRKFKHDEHAYTQGLIFVNNILFESTGQKNQSTIRKVNPKTGDVLLSKPMDSEIFGEGIALLDDKVYMLTYVTHIGFVFDTVNFSLIRKFALQTREGWGLTSDGKRLIMSDGSDNVYFMDPEYATILDQIEICDNTQQIDNINELEETPYGLFANIYGKSYIIIIDKETGIVTGKIDFSSIFPENIPKDMDHVLNGIAYNSKTKTFYITGKYWPQMYEVKINLN